MQDHNCFSSSQLITRDSSGATFDTVTSEGHIFDYTLDKPFTGSVGMSTPIGRQHPVQSPSGLHGQAITTPGPAVQPPMFTRGIVFDDESA